MCRIGPDNMRAVLDRLPIHKLRGVGTEISARRPRGGNPYVRRLALRRATRCCGAPSASMAKPCERWHRDRRPAGRCRIARRNRSAPRRRSPPTSADAAELERQLTGLADRAASRLRAHAPRARPGSRSRFDARISRRTPGSARCEPPTQDTAAISAMAQALLLEWLARNPDAAVRLLGVGVGDLQTAAPGRSVLVAAGPGLAARRDHRRHPGPVRTGAADPRELAAAPARAAPGFAPRLSLVSSA